MSNYTIVKSNKSFKANLKERVCLEIMNTKFIGSQILT